MRWIAAHLEEREARENVVRLLLRHAPKRDTPGPTIRPELPHVRRNGLELNRPDERYRCRLSTREHLMADHKLWTEHKCRKCRGQRAFLTGRPGTWWHFGQIKCRR